MKPMLAFIALLWQTAVFAQVGRGVATGQVLTTEGTPATGIRVAAISWDGAGFAGASLLMASSETDGAGRYRFEDLPPGRYLIAAGRLDAPTFFPGVKTLANAKPITVTNGAVVSGTDFTMKPPLRVSGRVESANESSGRIRQALVLLIPVSFLASTDQTGVVSVKAMSQEQLARALAGTVSANRTPDGSFEFTDVAPGVYVIAPGNFRMDSDQPPLAGLKTIMVGEHDLTGIVAQVPQLVRGFVILDQAGLAPPPFRVSFTDSVGLSTTATTSSGAFETALPAGNYRIRLEGIAAGFFAKSILYGTTDVLDAPLILGPDGGEIGVHVGVSDPPPWVRVSGRVIGLEQSADTRPRSFILSAPEGAMILSSPIQPDGSFDFGRVLPGTYSAAVRPLMEAVTMDVPIPELREIKDIVDKGYSMSIVIGDSDLRGLEVQLPSLATVSGQVTADHGARLPRVVLSLTAVTQQASGPVRYQRFSNNSATVKDGMFALIVLEGEYRVQVAGFHPPFELRSVTDGTVDLTNNSLRIIGTDPRNLSVALSIPAVSVRGHVEYLSLTEGTSGNMPIVLSGTRLAADLETQPKTDGSFEFPVVPPGSYELQLGEHVMPIQVAVADTDVEIKLEITTIKGKVLFAAGTPPPDITLSLRPSVSPDRAFYVHPTLRPDGTFTFGVPTGTYSVRIAGYHAGYPLKVVTDGAAASPEDEQNFTASRDNAIELRVVSVPTAEKSPTPTSGARLK